MEDDSKITEILDNLYKEMENKNDTYIGFPNSRLYDHGELSRFLKFPINNIGDPYQPNHGINTCVFEQEVLDFFINLFHLDRADSWGYITNGGTEGNISGLYQGREIYPEGILYFSEDSHYSLPKIAKLLKITSEIIPSLENGEIDYDMFKKRIIKNRAKPVIVNSNIGTTMKGAIDNVENIIEIIKSLNITDYYIHCDAALSGGILPFLKAAPVFDFRIPIASISVSGHKFFGAPIPCGILITRKSIRHVFKSTPSYMGSIDTTISGSRDGFSVLVLWHTINRYGWDGFKKMVDEAFELRDYTLKELQTIGRKAWANPHSTTIVLDNPGNYIVNKWQLASTPEIAHVIILPGVTKRIINNFITDLKTIKQ